MCIFLFFVFSTEHAEAPVNNSGSIKGCTARRYCMYSTLQINVTPFQTQFSIRFIQFEAAVLVTNPLHSVETVRMQKTVFDLCSRLLHTELFNFSKKSISLQGTVPFSNNQSAVCNQVRAYSYAIKTFIMKCTSRFK